MAEEKYSLVFHLEDLRKRLIYCIISLAVFFAVSWNYAPQIIKFASFPAGKLVFTHPTEAFFVYCKVCFWSGLFLALPVIIYNIWKFVESGMIGDEKRYILLFAPASFFLFLTGASFGFFLAIPLALKFLIGFGREFAEPMLSINGYLSFVGWLVFVFGSSFELPLAILFLAKLKVVTYKTLSAFRKQAILLIFIAAAVLTPTPDAFTQILLAGPLIILFELGIWLSRLA